MDGRESVAQQAGRTSPGISSGCRYVPLFLTRWEYRSRTSAGYVPYVRLVPYSVCQPIDLTTITVITTIHAATKQPPSKAKTIAPVARP